MMPACPFPHVSVQGLLFKVNGVLSASGTYTALAVIMTALCLAFLIAWLAVVVAAFARNLSSWRRDRVAALMRTANSLTADAVTAAEETRNPDKSADPSAGNARAARVSATLQQNRDGPTKRTGDSGAGSSGQG